MEAIFASQRAAAQADPVVPRALRADRLTRLETALTEAAPALIAAMSRDFSYRPAADCELFDITLSLREIRHARRSLGRWMRPRQVRAPLHLMPARGRLMPQPLGVVGILAPWNFPVYLAVAPLAAALAAGNRAMVKPSELTPQTAAALEAAITTHFTPEEVCVLQGGPEEAAAFTTLPFDHLLYTGSTAVGRKVAEAAARNMTPVTLELGGKSPAVLTPSADLDRAARRIAWGKGVNAGQVCVAPDYVLVPRPQMARFVRRLEAAFLALYPEGAASPDLAAIITPRHRDRLRSMLHEAETSGAEVIRLPSDAIPAQQHKFPPTIVVDPHPGLQIMREEIFGPLLPVVPYDTPEEALTFVAVRDAPLALYVFGTRREEIDLWLAQSRSGGVTVNDTVLHVAFDTLPFGGIGPSGQGAYHGDAGFEIFSHMKPVMIQPRLNAGRLMEPPVTPRKRQLLGLLRRMI
ncbi:aldehyde dehydrogenase family protein [Maritimibacter alkaliphilus]|uniref:aldehyde dehydrogenase family protein n=1 Tax=Maritimibacter alkaliphilus TaxID=404236 RepID=UPI001C98627C|nr:aldehyde dehydrogenase family protein [Maritimibacter alkaliphilus]MBY6091118.1 aldehyde dehydrogenase family protein [Maritimibacter alkaliphilus]